MTPHGRLNLICVSIAAVPFMLTGIAWHLLRDEDWHPLLDDVGLLPELLTLMGVIAILMAFTIRGITAARAARSPTQPWLAAYVLGTILTFAVLEAAAIVGLVVTLLVGDLLWSVAMSTLSLLAMGVAWPTSTRFRHWQARGAGPKD